MFKGTTGSMAAFTFPKPGRGWEGALIDLCSPQRALKLAPPHHQGPVVPQGRQETITRIEVRSNVFPGLIIPQVYKLQKHVNAPMIKIIECLIEKA